MSARELLDYIENYIADISVDIAETLHGDFVTNEQKAYEHGRISGMIELRDYLYKKVEEEE